jgi:hypothetical protein
MTVINIYSDAVLFSLIINYLVAFFKNQYIKFIKFSLILKLF